jgi:hypothetical protein
MNRNDNVRIEMPLNIDTTACVGQNPEINYHVAMAMYNTGVSDLKTQADADELYIRYRMMHLALNTLPTARILTYAEISSFVGCHTNVSRYTPFQWGKMVAAATRDSAVTIMNRHKEKTNA